MQLVRRIEQSPPWRALGAVSLVSWLWAVVTGGAVTTVLGLVTGLPWEAFTGAGTVAAAATAVVLGRRDRRRSAPKPPPRTVRFIEPTKPARPLRPSTMQVIVPAESPLAEALRLRSTSPGSLADRLQRRLDEGIALRERLIGPVEHVSTGRFVNRASDSDVDEWIGATEAELRGEPRLLAEFRVPAPDPSGTMEIYGHHMKSDAQRQMDQRLDRLERIIRGLP